MGRIRQLTALIQTPLCQVLLVVLNSDDPLCPSNHEARSVSNLLLITDGKTKPSYSESEKTATFHCFFSYCIWVNGHLTRAYYFQVFDEIEQ